MGKIFGLVKRTPIEQNLIYAVAVGAFLPFYLSAAVVIAVFITILALKKTRNELISQSYFFILPVFFVYSLVVAAAHLNWVGAACSLGFFMLLAIGQHVRRFMSRRVFFHSLFAVCYISGATALFAVAERLININYERDTGFAYRCCLYFFNPNYLATMFTMAILACAYLVISKKSQHTIQFYCIAFLDAVGIYLTGSIFAWVAVFIGVSVLLFISHRHQVLGIFLIVSAMFIIIAASTPGLFYRFGESLDTTGNRIAIWQASIDGISKEPVFGRGFLAYYQLASENPSLYQTTHAHNLLLDLLLSHGVVGTLMIGYYFTRYYMDVSSAHRNARHNEITGFIFACTAAVLVHSMVDMTMLWIQTGSLMIVFLGAVGIEERQIARGLVKR